MIQSSHIAVPQGIYMTSSGMNKTEAYKPRVLLVEDELIVQKVHQLTLQKLGCLVEIAANGITALEMYKKGYDLILLDCGLPDISGLEVGKIIREHEHQHKLPRIPLVMITAYIDDADLQQACNNAGIDQLVTKPVNDHAIWKALLERWLIKKYVL